MDDQNQEPALRNRPQPTAKPNKPIKRAKPLNVKKMSPKTKQNIIGFGILALGALALIWVGSMAFNKFFGGGDEAADIEQSELDEFREGGSAPNRAAGQRTEENKPEYKRQKSISTREMTGTWQAKLKRGMALIEIRNDTYRMVIIPSKTDTLRYYSNGTYEIKDDIVIMTPDAKSPPPKTNRYNYRILTRGKMVVMAGKYKGKLVWQEPPKDLRGIYVPNYNPVLGRTTKDVAVWELFK